MIDLNDYVAGGYFITKYAREGFWHSPLLPERVVSLSSCIGKPLEVYWGWDVDRYRQAILDFGIPTEKLPAFKEWSTGDQADHPNVFRTLLSAQQFITEFLPVRDEGVLLGAALPGGMVDDFLSYNKQQVFDANRQVYRDEVYGVNRVLAEKRPLEAGGDILGVEVVSYDNGGLGHSWLCGRLEQNMNELFGIHPNQHGLIDTYAEAKKVYQWITEDKMQGSRAEPEPYYPWLIVQYPPSSP